MYESPNECGRGPSSVSGPWEMALRHLCLPRTGQWRDLG
jgi:hypothetical protein